MSPQEQREARQDLDLTPLTERYELVAELRARENGRAFIGKRREDGADVLIFLMRASRQRGDRDELATSDLKSLTLFAADARALTGLSHRNLLPVLDTLWVGPQAVAVVTERTSAPTLAELIERGDAMSSSRAAEILREVNGLLEWARSKTVTHRGVRPDTLFVEPGTDRVHAMFVMRPLPLSGAIEPESDARTIAELAYAILSRGEAAPEAKSPDESQAEATQAPTSPLATLRPELPSRVVQETERILRSPDAPDTPTDVLSYLALVAMADDLKAVEEEVARGRAELVEEQRATREELESARTTFERTKEEETRKFSEERAELERRLAKERAEMQATLAKEREDMRRAIEAERKKLEEAREELEQAIASERDELAAEREILERIGAETVKHREHTLQRMKELEARREALARESKTARERARVAQEEADRAAEVTAAELSVTALSAPDLEESDEAPPSANATAFSMDEQVPLTSQPVVTADDRPVLPTRTPAAREPEPELVEVIDKRRRRMRRTVGASVGVVALVIVGALAAMNRSSSGTARASRTVGRSVVVDSAAGGLATRSTPPAAPAKQFASAVPLPQPTDSITAALAKTWTPRPRRRPRPRPVVVDSTVVDTSIFGALTSPAPLSRPAPLRPLTESARGRDSTAARRDSVVRRDSIRPRPDSVVKPPDSLSRR